MPAQDSLTDEEIAEISNYVRTTFGKGGEPVTPEFVAKIRAETEETPKRNGE
jgi:mono/diheme cytochrome c family protein